MQEKQCSRCKQIKPVSSFNKRERGRYTSHCKECRSAYFVTDEAKARHRIACKKYAQTQKGKEASYRSGAKYRKTSKFKKAIQKWRNANPERRQCHIKFANAIFSGKITRPSICSVCGSSPVEGHHTDYSKPFDVVWLCRQCHVDLHMALSEK